MYVMTHIMYFVKSFSLVIVLGILMYEKLYFSIYRYIILYTFGHENKTRFTRWGDSVVWRTAC